MYEKLVGTVTDLLNPGKNWGEFSRRMLSLVLVSSIGYIGYDLWCEFQEQHDKHIPVAEMIEHHPDEAETVRGMMETMIKAFHEIKGIWLYSWPDATTLDLVHHAGQGNDPIPAGSFHPNEAEDVGKLSMDICTVLNRKEKNTACTIFARGDAWGLIVVVWQEGFDPKSGAFSLVDAFANRITNLLYYHD